MLHIAVSTILLLCNRFKNEFIILMFVNFHSKGSKSKLKQSSQSRMKCTISGCYKSYSSAKNLNQHIKRNHLGQKFKCKLCGKNLETKYSAQRHVLAVHKAKCTKDNIEMVHCSPIKDLIPVNDQDNLIKEQQKTIETLQSQIKQTKDQIQNFRARLVAKRRLSKELKAENGKSLIILRKKY